MAIASLTLCAAAFIGLFVGRPGASDPRAPAADFRPEIAIEKQTIAEMRAALAGREPVIDDFSSLLIARASALSAADALAGQFQPRSDVAPFQLSFPIDWDIDPYGDRNWRFQLHAWRAAAPSLLQYRRTGARDHLAYVLATVEDWRRYHLGEGRIAEFSWFDMAAAYRALNLAYLIDALAPRAQDEPLEAARFDTLLELAALHVHALRQPAYLSLSNHGIFQAHGLMALCRVLDGWPPCKDGRAYAADAMARIAEDQFGDEGVHLEHSPGYHFFALAAFQRVVESGWYDDYSDIGARVDMAARNGAWLVDQNGRLPNVGDTEPELAPDPEALKDRLSDEFADGPLLARIFEEAGYAVLRTAASTPAARAQYLFFTCAHHASTHKHDDDLSLEWSVLGTKILSDAGKLTYDRDARRDYVLSRRAHNSIDFQEIETAPGRRRPHGGCVEQASGGETAFAKGIVDYETKKFRHARALYLNAAGDLRVEDEITGRAAGPFTVWWHFEPGVSLVVEGDGLVVARFAAGEARISTDAPACEPTLLRGLEAPSMQGWISNKYGDLEPRWSLGLECPGSVRNVTTLFDVTAGDQRESG